MTKINKTIRNKVSFSENILDGDAMTSYLKLINKLKIEIGRVSFLSQLHMAIWAGLTPSN